MSPVKAPIPQTVVADNYVRFKHESLEFLFAHLVDVRPIFGDDLDALLIFIAISRFYLRDERANPDAQDAEHGVNRRLTLSRIAEMTGIPRETTRRKLKLLQEKGLLEKGQYDNWQLSIKDGQPVIRTSHPEVWQKEMQRLVKLVRALKDCV